MTASGSELETREQRPYPASTPIHASAFLTLGAAGSAEIRVRGSRFVGVAVRAQTEAEARAHLAERQKTLHDATHHCSAWLLRDGTRRANDAGEPGGSAGPPILAAIEGAGLLDVALVVTRYFGGTKLGVGGLVRAYGDAAAAAIGAAPRRRAIPAVRLSVRTTYGHLSAVMRVLDRVSATGIEHAAAADGRHAQLCFVVPADEENHLQLSLRDASAGAVHADRLGETLLLRPGGN